MTTGEWVKGEKRGWGDRWVNKLLLDDAIRMITAYVQSLVGLLQE